MYCHKCGAKAIESAEFCQKCGAKLIVDIPVEQPVVTAQNNQVQQSAADSRVDPVQQPVLAPMNASGKRKSKLPIIIGIIGVIVVAAVLVALNWEGKADYEATVRAYTPYAESYGMPYTCGEVFEKYVPDADWKVRESGDVHYVDISGIAKGSDRELTMTVQVEAEEDRAVMKPTSVKLDGAELSENAFFALFVAYDEKDDDLSHIEDLISEVDFALRGGELSGVFSDEATGISFCYPDWWAELDTPSEYEIVEMISPRNSENHITTFKVSITFDVLDVFSGDESAVKKSLGEDCTFLDYGDIMLGDIPAKALTYQTKGLNGNDDIVVTFWYMIGEDVYRVACSYAASTSAIYGPMLQAIMESYTVAVDESGVGSPVEHITLVYDGDEGSWITLYSDGTFIMQVNVYAAYLTVSGTYEESDRGFKFHVERSFSGFIGDDVDEFEMVVRGYGMMEYQGDWIGTTAPGTIYLLDES